jgi:hypothetical protein
LPCTCCPENNSSKPACDNCNVTTWDCGGNNNSSDGGGNNSDGGSGGSNGSDGGNNSSDNGGGNGNSSAPPVDPTPGVGNCPTDVTCPTRCINCPEPAACVNFDGACFDYYPDCVQNTPDSYVIQCKVQGIRSTDDCAGQRCPGEECPADRFTCPIPSQTGTAYTCCRFGCLTDAERQQRPGRHCKCRGEIDDDTTRGNFCPGVRGCCQPNESCCGNNCCVNGCKDSSRPELGCACTNGRTPCGSNCCAGTETCMQSAAGVDFCCNGTKCGTNCCANGCNPDGTTCACPADRTACGTSCCSSTETCMRSATGVDFCCNGTQCGTNCCTDGCAADGNSCACGAAPNVSLPRWGNGNCSAPIVWNSSTMCMDVQARKLCLVGQCSFCKMCCDTNGGTGTCSIDQSPPYPSYSCLFGFSPCYSFGSVSWSCSGTDKCAEACAQPY